MRVYNFKKKVEKKILGKDLKGSLKAEVVDIKYAYDNPRVRLGLSAKCGDWQLSGLCLKKNKNRT